MARNMNVSVTLRLVDQLTQGARNAIQQLQQLTRGVQEFNRAAGGAGSNSPFGRLRADIRALTGDVQGLVGQFNRLGRAIGGTGTGGNLAQSHVAGMRQLLSLQQQAIANNARLAAPGGGGRVPSVPGAPPSANWWGRRGFNPNASLADRAQYRAVNFLEQSLGEAVLSPDIARTRLRRLDLSPETMRMAEEAAAVYSRAMPELTRGVILTTIAEIVTQFRTDAEAFNALPYLLRVQQLDIQAGRRGVQGMTGMLDLLKAVGMTGRLTDPEGTFTEQETAAVLDAYLRAREIGGVDINPQGFRQLIKYLKASAQTINAQAILEAALLAPDVGFSTFGNQTNMLIRSFAGNRATRMALEAQARWGLRTSRLDPSHPDGPNRLRAGQLVDSELLRENPNEWWRKHIMGPTGVLRRMGINPLRDSPARIADALAPLNSNMSAENIALIFTQMQGELQNQLGRALALNRGRPMWEAGPLDDASAGSVWGGLQRARARIIDSMQSIGDNFSEFVLPPLQRFADMLHNISDWTNPRTGNPAVGMGVLAAGGVGAFLLARGLIGRMGPWGRLLAGGAAGGLLGGDVTSLLMGAMIGRGFGGGATAAAGVAGAAAGAAWGGRFMAAVRWIFRTARSMTLWGLGTSVIVETVANWESVKGRLLGIWEELTRAAPTWLFGGGEGWRALASTNTGIAALPRDAEGYVNSWAQSVEGLLLGTEWGRSLFARGWLQTTEQGRLARDAQATLAMGFPAASGTVTIGSVTNHVTVQVASSNADPNAIGEAAGNAVGNALRTTMADIPGFF